MPAYMAEVKFAVVIYKGHNMAIIKPLCKKTQICDNRPTLLPIAIYNQVTCGNQVSHSN